jgi:hypothetical protein
VVPNRTGIVLELQQDCLNNGIPASTILRKAKVIAVKLGLDDLRNWIDAELGGYTCKVDDLPDHRKGIGQPKFHNPYHGWCTIMTDSGWFGKLIQTVYLNQPVSEIESLKNGKGDIIIMRYNSSISEKIQNNMPVKMEVALHFSKNILESSLDFIRNKTLDWSLELEQRDVIGQGLTFGERDKTEAQMVTNHIYGGNFGVLGSVTGDANNSGFYSTNGDLLIEKSQEITKKIEEALPALPSKTQILIRENIENITTELAQENPSSKTIQESFRSMRTVLEGMTGNIAASGIIAVISQLL